MDKKLFKSIIWLLTVAIVIIVCIIRFDMIRSALSFVFSLLAPLFVGLITAFILNPVYNFFCGLYSGEKVPKLFVVLGKFFSGIGRFSISSVCSILVRFPRRTAPELSLSPLFVVSLLKYC